MGRQIAIAMTQDDEASFLAFLRVASPIRIFRSTAPSAADLEVLGDDLGDGHQFFISPVAFGWQPEFKSVAADAPVVERRGWAYVGNASTGPVLEYDRHSFKDATRQGRLYWARVLSGLPGAAYDLAAFEAWFGQVTRWVKKTGRRIPAEPQGPYYLPSALLQRKP